MVLTTRSLYLNQQPDRCWRQQIHPAGIGIVLGLTAVFGALGWILRRVAIIRTILVTACWRSYWRWVGGRQPSISSDNGTGEIPVTDGDPDFAAYYKEPSKTIPDPNSTWFISTAKVSSGPILITSFPGSHA